MDARTAASTLARYGFATEFRPLSAVVDSPAHFVAVRVSGWFRVRAVIPIERHLRTELYIGVLHRARTDGPATEVESAFNNGNPSSAVRSALAFLAVVDTDWI